MNFLITNDDGWGSEGIRTLEEAAKQFGDVWVVAPAEQQSGISHRITLDTPLQLIEKAPRSYSLGGTPADCVRWSKTGLAIEFDWILSGINNGANLGADIFVSGTVAAVREAILHGDRAIAFSQHMINFGQPGFDWSVSRDLATKMIGMLIADTDHGPGAAFNVNFPDCGRCEPDTLEIHYCDLDFSSLPAKFEPDGNGGYLPTGVYNQRHRVSGGDVDRCFGGSITVTGINLDLSAK